MIQAEKTYKRNGIETVVYNEIFRLNDKHIEENVVHKYSQENTIKYHTDHRRHRYVLDGQSENNPIEFHRQKLGIK